MLFSELIKLDETKARNLVWLKLYSESNQTIGDSWAFRDSSTPR